MNASMGRLRRLLAGLAIAAALPAQAATWQVGPDGDLPRLADAPPVHRQAAATASLTNLMVCPRSFTCRAS